MSVSTEARALQSKVITHWHYQTRLYIAVIIHLGSTDTTPQQDNCSSSLAEPLGHGLPVDHVPDGAEVLGLAVLVLQVVGVLPGVDAQQGDQVAGDGVLVRAGDQAQGARLLVLGDPGPAAALNAGEGGVGLLDEGRVGAEVALDGFLLARCTSVLLLLWRPVAHFGLAREGRRKHPGPVCVTLVLDSARTLSSPSGSPPPSLLAGARFSQNRVWLTCPPPWKLRRGATLAALDESPLASASPRVSRALLRPLT